jgi:hypothetical protein
MSQHFENSLTFQTLHESPIDIPVPDQHWDGTPLDVIMTGDRPEPMRMTFLLGPDRELIELCQAAT